MPEGIIVAEASHVYLLSAACSVIDYFFMQLGFGTKVNSISHTDFLLNLSLWLIRRGAHCLYDLPSSHFILLEYLYKLFALIPFCRYLIR